MESLGSHFKLPLELVLTVNIDIFYILGVQVCTYIVPFSGYLSHLITGNYTNSLKGE